MPYNSQITRSDAGALMPEDVSREILQGVPEKSIIMGLMPTTKLPQMTRAQKRIPVATTLPTAYFLNAGQAASDTRAKQTTSAAWDNVYLNAEELAVIVPIPEAVLEDSDYDIWGEIKPRIMEAFGVAIDAAIIKGTNAPDAWPDDLVTQATAAGNVISLASKTDLYEAILSEGGTLSLLEDDGYLANGHVGAIRLRSKLRGARDADGRPIFLADPTSNTKYTLDGEPVTFPRNGVINPSTELLISGDWTQLVWALRQDLSYKLLTEATIYNSDYSAVQYALAQQDMVALRCVMRLGWATPWNKIKNRVEPTDANRCPFGILIP